MQTCGKCGFLSLRVNGSSVLMEAHDGYRESREMTKVSFNGPNLYDAAPLCFVRKLSLKAECKGKEDPASIVSVLNANRDQCEGFVPWDQGFSPKEHAEKMYNETLLKMRREESEANKLWREKQAEREHCWRAEQADRDRKWRKEDQDNAAIAFSRERYKAWVVVAWTLAASCITWLLAIVALK